MKSRFDSFMPLLVVLIIGLAYSTYHLHKECKALKQKSTQLENTAANIGQAPQSSTVVKTDKGDITVVTTEPLKATEKVIETRHKEDMKIVQNVGVKAKDIDELSHIGITTGDSVTVPVKVEPFGGLTASYEDDYTRIDVSIDTAKVATIEYEMSDSIVVVSSRKRHSILFGLIKWKGKTTKVQAYSKNPKATVKSVEVIERLE